MDRMPRGSRVQEHTPTGFQNLNDKEAECLAGTVFDVSVDIARTHPLLP